MRELLWSRMSRFPAFSPFYCSLLPPEETLVNIEMLGGQGQKNTLLWEHIRAILSLLAASACGKMRLVTMVKVPRRENKNHGEGWVYWHMPVIPGVRWWKQEDCKFQASLDCIGGTTKQNETQQPKHTKMMAS